MRSNPRSSAPIIPGQRWYSRIHRYVRILRLERGLVYFEYDMGAHSGQMSEEAFRHVAIWVEET